VSGRSLVAGAVAIAALVVLVLVVADPFGSAVSSSATIVPTASARVVRTNVVERQQVAGTLDYSGNFAVSNAGAAGVVTWLPAAGAVVRRGHALYALDRDSIRLLYGSQPASRDLTLGEAGADVRELQQNLEALGFTAGGALNADGRFDAATLVALERWQRSLGEQVTGTLPLGSIVFLPSAVRVATLTASAGAQVAAGGPILAATSSEPAVLIPLDPGTVSQLALGDSVLVTMPDGTTVHGRVTSIGRVATAVSSDNSQGGGGGGGGGGSPPTVSVTVSLNDPRAGAGLDQAPVQVAITVQEDRRVLAVPISALLAQPGGGYAVEVFESVGTRLFPVTTGLFDDVAGNVEVTGPGLSAGMRVQVPSQ
jgi:peptidoglycan hydrolase-like protein with peptidoglycan-binding domain